MPCQQCHRLWARTYFIFSSLFSNILFFSPSGLPRPVAAFGQGPELRCHQLLLPSQPGRPCKPITETPVRMRGPCVPHLQVHRFPPCVHLVEPRTWTRKVTPLTTSKPDPLLHTTPRDKGSRDLELDTGRRKGIQLGL